MRRSRLPVVLLAGVLALGSCASGSAAGEASDASAPTGESPSSTVAATEPATAELAAAPEALPAAGTEVGGDDELYAVPDPIPDGEPGTLLRYQPIEPTVQAGATSYRIMYLSESVSGEPIVVTGTALVPDAEAPEGGRARLTIAHGTTGIADECAPSRDLARSELSLTTRAVEAGWLVAMSDYEGLGTPGRHPYLVGESEGRSVLDAARAAAALPGADAGDQLLVAGYSQGGHGAMWAAQLAEEWTPELDLVGTFSGAPASEVEVILKAAPRLPQAGFAYMLIAGLAAAHPELDLGEILTAEGLRRLEAVDEGCARETFSAVAGVPVTDLIQQDGVDSGPWPERAADSNAGTVATDAPLLVIHSAADTTVPIAFSQIMADRLCALGQVVERRVSEDGKAHGPEAVSAYPAAFDWFQGLLAGEEPVSTCP